MATDPDYLEYKREMGRRLAASRAGAEGRPPGSESRVRAGRSISETRMAWCPPAYRDAYHELIRRKGLRHVEARELIESDIRRDRENMSPFERQMEALKKGAGLIEKPVLRAREYEFTLGGVADL